MTIQSNIPNVKQPFVNSNGYINKAWLDFLRRLWLRTGGDVDMVDDEGDDLAFIESIAYSKRVQDLEKRITDLEKELNQLGC